MIEEGCAIRFRIVAAVLFCIMLFSPLTSSAAPEHHAALVRASIELAGIDKELASFPEQIDAFAAQMKLTSKNPAEDDRVAQLIKDSYDIDYAEDYLFDYLLNNSDENTLAYVLAWLETPLGRKITAEEVSAHDPGEAANMLHFVADMQSSPPPQSRIALVQQLEETAGLTEHAVNIAVSVMRGMMSSVNAACAPERQKNAEEINAMIAEIKPVLSSGLRQQILLSCFYTYRNLTDEEVEAYIQFLGTRSSKKFNNLVVQAITHVFNSSFAVVGEKIASLADKES